MKFISFDADGTLVDPKFMDTFWNVKIPQLYARKTGLEFEEAKAEVEAMYHSIGEGDINWYLPEYWFSRLGLKESFKEVLLSLKHEVKIFSEVEEVLQNLGKKARLIVLSNAPAEILDLELLHLRDHFSKVISSISDFKQVRKTPDFYRRACKTLEIKPEELVHIGDHYEFDYIAPAKAGVNAFLLDRNDKIKESYAVRDLKEFEKILQSFL